MRKWIRYALLLSAVLVAIVLTGCPSPTACNGGRISVSVTNAGSFVGHNLYAAIYEKGADPMSDPYLGWLGGDLITSADQFIAFFKDDDSNPVVFDKGTYDVGCFVDFNDDVDPDLPSPNSGDYSSMIIEVTVSCGDATCAIDADADLSEIL